MKMHPMKGISFTLVFGGWVKPHMRRGEFQLGICLGFVALTLYTLDIEEFMLYLRNGLDELAEPKQ